MTLVTAGLAAIIFPVTLFALQGIGEFSPDVILAMLTLYLFQPASIVLIFLASFRKLPRGRPTQAALGVVSLNVLLLLATAGLIQSGTFKGDAELPVLLAVPSILFLLNSSVGAWRNSRA